MNVSTKISSKSYYPFGMVIPGRSFSTTAYKWGFNGKEKDDEVYGSGNLNTAMFWEYDTRLGRRWNLDPVYNAYESRYLVFGGNPIMFNDPNGDYKTRFGAWFANLFKKGEVKQASAIGPNGEANPRAGEYFFQKSGKPTIDGAHATAYRPDFGGKAFNKAEGMTSSTFGFGVHATHDFSSSVITYSSAIVMPVINQVHVIAKEGAHEGYAYNSENKVSWAVPYKLVDWKLKKLDYNSDETEKEVLKSTLDVGSLLIPVKAPAKLTEPLLSKISSEGLKKSLENAINFGVSMKVKGTVKKPIKKAIDEKL